MPARNYTGYSMPTLVDVFYNRILVEPAELDMGVVVTSQEEEILVWNAYLESTVNLETLTETDFDGISVSGDVPPPDVEFAQLEERTYTILVDAEGDPTIDASLTFDWETPYDDNVVTIVGERIIMFPYYYKVGASESLEWSTRVLTSKDGTEARSRIRTSPRQKFAVKSYIEPNEHSRVDNMLWGWRSQIWAIPVWGEARIVTSAVSADDTEISVSTLYGDFRAGDLAAIYEDSRTIDLFEIASFTDTTISIDRGITEDFSASAVVIPIRKGRMRQAPQRSSTGYNATLSISFEVDDNEEIDSEASDDTFLDEDVYLTLPLKPGGEVFQEKYEKDITTIDFLTGAVSQYSNWTYTKLSREFLVILEGLEDIWEFRTWLHRRAGKQRPFYMPTFEGDIRPNTTGNMGTSFTAYNDDNAKLASDRTNIYIQMDDGTYYFRTITDIFTVSDDEISVTIDTTVVEELGDVDFISYMGLKRLASDRIQMTWLQNEVVQCKIPIVEIQP